MTVNPDIKGTPRSDPPPQTFRGDVLVSNTKYIQIQIRPRVRLCGQATAVVNRADRRLAAGVVNCCSVMRRSEFVVHNRRSLC